MKIINGFKRSAIDPVGRCKHCNTAYEWAKGMKVQLRYAHCPQCGRHLAQTTRLLTTGEFAVIERADELARRDCVKCEVTRVWAEFDADLRRIKRDLPYARTESDRAKLEAERAEILAKQDALLRDLSSLT